MSSRFLPVPLSPAPTARLIAGHDLVALGSVSVTDSRGYATVDPETVRVFAEHHDPALAKSLETTHGLIRVQSDAPFLFVSGIANRVGFAASELFPRFYAQSTAAAHNAAIVVA